MTKHFLRELEQLKRDVLVMGGLSETALNHGVRAFLDRAAIELGAASAPAASAVDDGDVRAQYRASS